MSFNEALILGIDTTSPTGSIAIGTPTRIIGELIVDVTTTHSESLLANINFLLQASRLQLSDIEALAVTIGPGSFTGIRIGLATAKGICYAQQKTLFTFSSLRVLAQNFPFEKQVCAMLNAQKNEIYAAVYQNQKEILAPASFSPNELATQLTEPCLFVGSGFAPYHALFSPLGKCAPPHLNKIRASSMLNLIAENNSPLTPFSFESLANVHPVYLRKSEAEIQREKRLQKN